MSEAPRRGITCAHCHEINFTDEPHYPRCHACGHQADKPRYLCECDFCKNMRHYAESQDKKKPKG